MQPHSEQFQSIQGLSKEAQIADLQAEIRSLKKSAADTLAKHIANSKYEQFVANVMERPTAPPLWVAPQSTYGKKLVIPTAMLSDEHFDEVVDPAQVNGVNAYNRRIAEKRLKMFFESTVKLAKHYYTGLNYPGIVLALGGDNVSGNIHEELRNTNAASIADTVLHFSSQVEAGIRLLADEFGKVFIPCVVGNHGRLTHKPIAKGRVRDNFDWLFYQILARDLKDDKRITFAISDAADISYTVFNTTFLLTHGDQFRGGSGIAGLLSPLLLGDARKRKRAQAVNAPYDYMLMGHWHQLTQAMSIIVNGCFTGDTLVQTTNGVKPIEAISLGDAIISRDGTPQTVEHLFRKESEDGLVVLKVRGVPSALRVTPNHLIWAVKGESSPETIEPRWRAERSGGDLPQWIPADFVSPGDFVHIPVPQTVNEEPFSEDLAWAYGLYLAEGHSLVAAGASKKHFRIEFTMHIDEHPVLSRVKSILDKELESNGREWTRPGKTTSHLSYSGEAVAREFRARFGHRAHGKKVPAEFFNLSPRLCRAVIQGWIDGDGHTRSDGVTCATSVSPDLAYAMFRIALIAGLRPSMAVLKAGGRRKSDSYTIHFNAGQESKLINGELFYRVHHRFRNRLKVPVFDLQVSGEHTYTAGLIGVHNSLKGLDEYAFLGNFGYEPPQQAFFLNSAERKQIWGFTPIHVTEAKDPYSGTQRKQVNVESQKAF